MVIRSDASDHVVLVAQIDVVVETQYICVPQEDAAVFRQMTLKNPLDAPLLAGPVDVYVDDRYLLCSEIAAVAPGGELHLGLGVEQAIKVARNVRYDEEPAGMLKRQQSTVHAVEVSISNTLHRGIKLQVRERMASAAPGHENDVQVGIRQVVPPWTAYDQRAAPIEGTYAWAIELAAGEQRTLKATWAIAMNPSFEIVGGNRRES